jgi:hypothetical protein
MSARGAPTSAHCEESAVLRELLERVRVTHALALTDIDRTLAGLDGYHESCRDTGGG